MKHNSKRKTQSTNIINSHTLDIHHSKYIEKNKDVQKQINYYEKELKETLFEIKKLEIEILNNNYNLINNDDLISVINNENTINNDNLISVINNDNYNNTKLIMFIDKKIDYEIKLNELKRDYDDTSYYTETSDILFKYYDIFERGDTTNTPSSFNNNNSIPVNSILTYFKAQCIPEKKKEDVYTCVKNKTELESNKSELLTKYISLTDKNFVPVCQNHKDKCEYCESTDMVVMNIEGYMYCLNCNNMEFIIIDNEKPYYKDPPKEVTYFSYKRINHFNEWLSKIQAKETTNIPDDVYDKILLEIKKQRITNMADIHCNQIKSILKSLKKNKYYEHIAHIIYRLNGVPTPSLSPDLEEKLRSMFKQIQIPFWTHSPPKRKNFLSYSYVLHKMIQLLEKDEYLPCFQLLRSREKLAAQDAIWKLICKDLGWQFYPSL